MCVVMPRKHEMKYSQHMQHDAVQSRTSWNAWIAMVSHVTTRISTYMVSYTLLLRMMPSMQLKGKTLSHLPEPALAGSCADDLEKCAAYNDEHKHVNYPRAQCRLILAPCLQKHVVLVVMRFLHRRIFLRTTHLLCSCITSLRNIGSILLRLLAHCGWRV